MVALGGMLLMLCIFVGSGVLLVKLVRLAFGRGSAQPQPVATEPSARPYEAAVIARTRRPVAPAAPADSGSGSSSSSSTPVDTRAETLRDWRYRQLLELGLDPVTAADAALTGIEVSAVRTLVERGCPAPLALRIAAPSRD